VSVAAVRRAVIVNADDFGQSDGTTAGIIRAHEHGVVTSTSLMVRWPAAGRAAAYARERPQLSVGLHLDLAEWKRVGFGWEPIYEVAPLDDPEAVRAEVQRQFDLFRSLVGREPTHVDSHQHVHTRDEVRDAVLTAARAIAAPVRHFDPRVRYNGGFYGQSAEGELMLQHIHPEALVALIRDLPDGISEIGCHPAAVDDLDTMYAHERLVELATLCDPAVRAAFIDYGVALVSFADVVSAL
jgi:predicted glycoside hydrolase/deacetylase ChbG (UPF0249 family)